MIVVHPGFMVPVPGLIVGMSHEFPSRHGDRVPLDLAGARALAPGLYRIPAVAQPQGLRSVTPCHAAPVRISGLSLYSRPKTKVCCPKCRRRWTVSQLGTEHALWAG
ncbi:MAG: hypothetical protein ACRDTT_34300 [Pseudonocardiaceae bacterium]